METSVGDLLAIIGELTVRDRANTARIAALEARVEELEPQDPGPRMPPNQDMRRT